jgi:integrase
MPAELRPILRTTDDEAPRGHHCPQREYLGFIRTVSKRRGYALREMAMVRRFTSRWPVLQDWFEEPLHVRVGAERFDRQEATDARITSDARPYLLYLALRGNLRFDYPWLLAAHMLYLPTKAAEMGMDIGLDELIADALRLGYRQTSTQVSVSWPLTRILLRSGLTHARFIRAEHVTELNDAVRAFLASPLLAEYYPQSVGALNKFRKTWLYRVNQFKLLMFHRGQFPTQPRKFMPAFKDRSPTPPQMQAIVDRWLSARTAGSHRCDVKHLDLALYRFMVWLAHKRPAEADFSNVTRDDVLAYVQVLRREPSPRTGRPLSTMSLRGHVAALAQFFGNTGSWGWSGVPAHAIVGPGDIPRLPMRIPRFIPDAELQRLMAAIALLPCPYQRTALLIARWSGARRGEIQRLAVDCLDQYPDGTPRLRIPAGKTYRERIIPLHDEAAAAIRELVAVRTAAAERPFIDEVTREQIHYLFMDHGRLLSDTYLFQIALKKACIAAGLVDAAGRTIHVHRFRHTVGTQLAERGAKLHTIMSILGHSSASMSLVYAQISDREVLRDYRAVLAPWATIAGRGAEAIRDGKLRPSAIDWLKCNFFKTELELGHCLRLPEEGPCECDLYLTCAKFVTTPAYVPRLRVRRQTELTLAADANVRGWIKEEERHRATISRIDQLLQDLGEAQEGVASVDKTTLIRGSETKSFCARKLKSDRETQSAAKGGRSAPSTWMK